MDETQLQVQWYPGHMTKTRRQMENDLKIVDAVCEIVDARIPVSSRNPDLDSLCRQKPRVVILNRMDLADAAATREWQTWFRSQNIPAVATDCKSRRGIDQVAPAVRSVLKEKLERDTERNMNRPVKAMIVGIPNVGKSTLINQISRRKSAKAENRPGVTRGRQWVDGGDGLLLLDTPGILWPKFSDPNVGLMLAATGAIKDTVVDAQELAVRLMELLYSRYPRRLEERYGLDGELGDSGYVLLEKAGRKRGCLLARGEIDTERMARILLEEFRSGKMGRLTLELPEEGEG